MTEPQENPAPETFPVIIQLVDHIGNPPKQFDPVTVEFYQPNGTQVIMLGRGAALIERMPSRAMFGIAQILDVLDALVVDPEQQAWLTDNMVHGYVELDNLKDAIDGIRADDAEPSAKSKLPVKRARSGRR